MFIVYINFFTLLIIIYWIIISCKYVAFYQVKVSDTPWDVSDVNVDHLANNILQHVQTQKNVKPKKQKIKKAITIVAPDELESLEELDSAEDYESDVSDDILTAIEQNVVKMAAMGLKPDGSILEHLASIDENKLDVNTAVGDEPKTSAASEVKPVTVPSSKETSNQLTDEIIDTFTTEEAQETICDDKESCDDDIIIESVTTTAATEGEEKNSENSGTKQKKKSFENRSANESVIFQANSPSKPYRASKPSKLPKVEFKLEDVLQHPQADQFLQRCGRVVNIVEFKHNRCAVGILKPHADRNPRCALFSPSDSRIPRLNIPMGQCPDMFLQKYQEFSGTLFLARIDSWDYPGKATGSLIKNLGDTDDINARTDAILYDLNIDFQEFSQEVLDDLPANHADWSIPEAEVKLRREFRGECVFTSDPKTARDLDDALSVSPTDDGNYTVGVHIADVAYFVREGTNLDRSASERTTSTYLAQRVIPMLPRPLCENLCSLNPGVDRLSYSVEWTIDSEGKILSEWFGRTVIRSCVKLSYDHAQMMIDEPDRITWEEGIIPGIQEPYSQETISQKVNMLQKLALILRAKRETNGYLKISQPKLAFELNSEGMPYSFKVYEHKHSNRLIEEFMLLANMAVARKIYTIFPELAVLR
jgi:exoribonuclease R